MDYLFITRIWILLWSCMWACDFLDFSWTLFIFPSVKGEDYSQTIWFICYKPYHMTQMVFMICSILFYNMGMYIMLENVKMKCIIMR